MRNVIDVRKLLRSRKAYRAVGEVRVEGSKVVLAALTGLHAPADLSLLVLLIILG
jgi:hypothetical protein